MCYEHTILLMILKRKGFLKVRLLAYLICSCRHLLKPTVNTWSSKQIHCVGRLTDRARQVRKQERHLRCRQQSRAIALERDDGRLQAYGWSLPSKFLSSPVSSSSSTAGISSRPSSTHVAVPVPVYCRPVSDATGVKVSFATASYSPGTYQPHILETHQILALLSLFSQLCMLAKRAICFMSSLRCQWVYLCLSVVVSQIITKFNECVGQLSSDLGCMLVN